jgi:hypothetical protein
MKDSDARRRIGTNVSKAIDEAGMSRASVAEAIGLPSSDGESRIVRGDLTVPQLVRAGGLLRVPASSFLRGVA